MERRKRKTRYFVVLLAVTLVMQCMDWGKMTHIYAKGSIAEAEGEDIQSSEEQSSRMQSQRSSGKTKGKEEVISKEAIPEETVSEKVAPEEVVSENVVPNEADSEKAVPDEVVSEKVVPEEVASEKVVSEKEVPEEKGESSGKLLMTEKEALNEAAGLVAAENYEPSAVLIVQTDSPDCLEGYAGLCIGDGLYLADTGSVKAARKLYKKLEKEGIPAEYDTAMRVMDQECSVPSSVKAKTKASSLKTYLDQSSRTKKEVKVAIIDTGIDPADERFTGRITDLGINLSSSGERDSFLDDNGHGTKIAAVVAENTADNVAILPIKAANAEGKATVLGTYLALKTAVEAGADVINVSMCTEIALKTKILDGIMNQAAERGIAVIVAAGNGSADAGSYSPANIAHAVTVSAVEADGTFSDYSNYGDIIDYCAYGGYGNETGTSYAAAYVSAAVAACLSIGADYENVFQTYGVDLGKKGKDAKYGNGLIAFTQPLYEETAKEDKSTKANSKKDKYTEGEKEKAEKSAATVPKQTERTEEAKREERAEKAEEAEREEWAEKMEEGSMLSLASEGISLSYRVHLSTGEWTGYVKDGAAAGSTSKTDTKKRMDAVQIKLTNGSGISGGIQYRTHITSGYWNNEVYYYDEAHKDPGGWSAFVSSGEASGAAGRNKHLEAVTLKLTGDLSNYYFIDYSAFTKESPAASAITISPEAPKSLRYQWTGVVDSEFLSENPSWDPGPYNTTKNFAGTFMYTLPISAFKAKVVPRKILYTINPKGGKWGGTAETAEGYMNAGGEKSIPDPVRAGYTFTGWTIKHDSEVVTGIGNGYQEPAKAKSGNFDKTKKKYTAGNRDVVFTAGWKKNTLTVKYNANGGNVSPAAEKDITSYQHDWEYTTADRDLVNFSSFGLHLTGYHPADGAEWNTKANGSGSKFDQNVKYKMTDYASDLAAGSRKVTMYAQWDPNTYTVKYNGNKNTGGSMADSIHTYDTAKELTPNAFKRTGYQFNGWNTKKDGAAGTNYKDRALVKNLTAVNRAAVELYAKWNPVIYKVKYNANGGTGNMTESQFTYDMSGNLSANAFVRDHYEFKGWSTSPGEQAIRYTDKQLIKNLAREEGAVINLYAQWERKVFNVAYSGNGQSAGMNKLEPNVWLGNKYQFRDNIFEKKEKEVRTSKTGRTYEVEQEYSFQGWGMYTRNVRDIFKSGSMQSAADLYRIARNNNTIIEKVADSSPYEEVSPLINMVYGKPQKAKGNVTYAKEYINIYAQWDAYPAIEIEPKEDIDNDEEPRIENNILFFYEGEKPKKKDLISYLTVNDKEDGDLINQIKVKKIVYSNGTFVKEDGTAKKGYTLEWDEDIPEDYIFDTYYQEMNVDEVLTHMVTYEVTDSVGNKTTREYPVRVKYNYPPAIDAAECYYYYKNEVNNGKVTENEIISLAKASDVEDKEGIEDKIKLKDFDLEGLKTQTTSTAEFQAQFEVTDRFQKTTNKSVKIVVVDENALEAERPIYYLRYISEKHLDTLEKTSKWREKENQAYLQNVLKNKVPTDIWNFTHEDIMKIQNWIINRGDGNWNIGQSANRDFLVKFSKCKL